jgi:hypothetical protein
MEEIRIFKRCDQVLIMEENMLMVLAFKDGEYAPDFPAFSSGQRGAQLALFITGKLHW